jgi:hypothetical protein
MLAGAGGNIAVQAGDGILLVDSGAATMSERSRRHQDVSKGQITIS